MKKLIVISALLGALAVSSMACPECDGCFGNHYGFCSEAEAVEQAEAIEPAQPTEEPKKEPKPVEEPMDEDEEELVYAGNFKLTFYCPCTSCCGENAQGITASGTVATEGRTVSADPNILPLGTRIYIDGYGELIVEDTGSAINGNVLDIYLSDHNRCLEEGVQYKDVYIVK